MIARPILAALVLALVLPRAWAADPSPHAIDIPKWFVDTFLDVREDVRDAAREGKRLMLYFGQDGCPYCKALMKVNFAEPDIVATTRAHFMPIALNLWGDREVTWIDGRRMGEKELARVLRVQYTPTLLFLDEEARVVLRLNGYVPPDKFRQALEYVRLKMEARQAYSDYVAGLAPDARGAQLGTQPFFERGAADLAAFRKAVPAKPLLVLYERTSCRDCAELHREGLSGDEVRRLAARFRVVQLDLLGSRPVVAPDGKRTTEREWARALQVANTPTLVFFDAAGAEVFRTEGYVRPFHLASAMDYVANGAYRGEPSFQRFIQKRADGMRAAGKTVDLWK